MGQRRRSPAGLVIAAGVYTVVGALAFGVSELGDSGVALLVAPPVLLVVVAELLDFPARRRRHADRVALLLLSVSASLVCAAAAVHLLVAPGVAARSGVAGLSSLGTAGSVPEAFLLTGQAAAGAAMLLVAAGFVGASSAALLPGVAWAASGIVHVFALAAATHGQDLAARSWAGRAWLAVPLAAAASAWAWRQASGRKAPASAGLPARAGIPPDTGTRQGGTR